MKTIYNNVLRLLLVALMAMPLLATAQVTLTGTGTAADTYLIGTADELEAFAQLVNGGQTTICAKLTANIDYTGKTEMIGSSTYPYAGTFDGNNHKITINYNTTEEYTGLFRYIGNNGNKTKIRNLYVTGNITTTNKYAGGVVAYLYEGNAEITKVISDVIITYSGASSTETCNGGIVAQAYYKSGSSGTSGTCKIENCAFNGKFIGDNSIGNGGIVGLSCASGNEYNRYVNINKCYVTCKYGNGNNCATMFRPYDDDYDGTKRTKVSNSYFLDWGFGSEMHVNGNALSESQFNNGTACRLLNNFNPDGVWRQNLVSDDKAVDPYPVLDPKHDKVQPLPAYTQSFTPLEIDLDSDETEFDGNSVLGATEKPSKDITIGLDAAYNYTRRYCYFDSEAPSVEGAEGGFPKTVSIKNINGFEVPFNMTWKGTKSFDGSDCVELHKGDGNNEKEIQFKKFDAFSELYICAVSGGANENVPSLLTTTIKYTDGTELTTKFYVNDWFAKDIPNSNSNVRRCLSKDGKIMGGSGSGTMDAAPYLFCYSLLDALDDEKPVKGITFKCDDNISNITNICIYAITGMKISKVPMKPKTVSVALNEDNTAATLSWSKVTKLINGEDAVQGTISYYYDVATDKDFTNIISENNKLVVEGYPDMYSKEITGNFGDKYVRVRAVNDKGPSLNTEVRTPVLLYDDKSESETYGVAIPAMQAKIQEWNNYCAPGSESEKTIDVKVMRSFTNTDEYYTLCLPFDVSDEQIADELQGCSVYKYEQARINNGVLDIVFESATEIEAGVPYFIKWSGFGESGSVVNPVFEDVIVETTTTKDISGEYATCHGTLVPVTTQLEPGNRNILFLVENNTFQWPDYSDETRFKGLRAYLEVNSTKVRYGMPTSIVENPDADIEIEDPEVQKLYQNGRIVIIKDGVKYDLFGRVIE